MSPRATYRLQFHKAFAFADAVSLASYFAGLNISHLYASPILTARAGSTHGYDVIDHARVNPELGGEDGFRALAGALRAHDIGIILDIVPNHMAVGGADNPYWLDVLEKGRDSIFATLFDIDWEPGQSNIRERVLVPFLGKPLAEALTAHDIELLWDDALGKFAFAYAEHRFPLRPEDYPEVLGGAENPAQADLERFDRPEALAVLLQRQNFRLSFWREAGDRINWRRFFDISGLAALRMEDDAVFEMVHATILRLYAEGLVDGLRVDHVDGLADPGAYCRRLRARLDVFQSQRPRKDAPYIVVEKILVDGERLPAEWNVDGTTGYDFMNRVSALQHDARHAARFATLWADISGRAGDFETEERLARHETLSGAFGNALRAAAITFCERFPESGLDSIVFEQALSLLLERFRAYRTYATGDSAEPPPGPLFDAAVKSAYRDADRNVRTALALVASAMHGEEAGQGAGARDAARRFNQLAAPIAARAVEDTAFYRYGRILSRNDVGFSPGRFALAPDEFLAVIAEENSTFPASLLATATHDHKRGEDARARLAALSEIPDVWEEEVRHWFALNAPLRSPDIDFGDEYQLYQTLVGSWPMHFETQERENLSAFTDRILAWREKSLREAKLRTSWSTPNLPFEKANADFVRALLDPHRSQAFLERLANFVERLAPAGVLNSLCQTILRYTCPGVPDLYQGTELWDFSLVDPDNRRPVDFPARQKILETDAAPAALLGTWQNGHVKFALIKRLLALRGLAAECFAHADPRPLNVTGANAQHVMAFTRSDDKTAILVAVPRLCAKACITQGSPLAPGDFWGDCAISLDPDLSSRAWKNALDPNLPIVTGFGCTSLFADFPVAVLVSGMVP